MRPRPQAAREFCFDRRGLGRADSRARARRPERGPRRSGPAPRPGHPCGAQGTARLHVPTLFQGLPPLKATAAESFCLGTPPIGGVVSKNDAAPFACRKSVARGLGVISAPNREGWL